MDICVNTFFLRILYLVKVALNIIRFVVPLLLIIKIAIDVYKKIINPDAEVLKNVKNRLLAALIVFLVPTIIPLLMNFIGSISGNDYNTFTTCYEFADLEYIKVIEEERDQAELEAYLSKQEKALTEGKRLIAAYRNIVESYHTIIGVGEYANNKNKIQCGTGSQYNDGLFNAVRSAGYKTREGVVAAALYVSSHINVHIPYFWSGGHFHHYGSYSDSGDNFIGIPDKWGCEVAPMDPTSSHKTMPFGMDCSGFVAWAIYNGGYYTGDPNQKVIISTTSPGHIMGVGSAYQPQTISFASSKGKLKAGDILYTSGHVGLVIEVKDDYVMLAEEKGLAYGLVVSKLSYGSRFSHAMLMDNFYNNYQKGTPLYSKFN